MNVFRTKSVEQSIAETDEPDHRLKKNLGVLDLIIFGVGVIIGAGIFVVTGTVAKTNSGPAITLSFAIAGLACALAALCYAEFASTVPVAGSAYTFSYATFGELVAWIIGWDLALEFTIGSAALAVGFSGYLMELLDGTAFELPAAAAAAAGTKRYACLVALGAVIRGDTPHFEYVAGEAAHGLNAVAVSHALPVGFGVLTVDASVASRTSYGGTAPANVAAQAARWQAALA